jgi:hypothetical protein
MASQASTCVMPGAALLRTMWPSWVVQASVPSKHRGLTRAISTSAVPVTSRNSTRMVGRPGAAGRIRTPATAQFLPADRLILVYCNGAANVSQTVRLIGRGDGLLGPDHRDGPSPRKGMEFPAPPDPLAEEWPGSGPRLKLGWFSDTYRNTDELMERQFDAGGVSRWSGANPATAG